MSILADFIGTQLALDFRISVVKTGFFRNTRELFGEKLFDHSRF